MRSHRPPLIAPRARFRALAAFVTFAALAGLGPTARAQQASGGVLAGSTDASGPAWVDLPVGRGTTIVRAPRDRFDVVAQMPASTRARTGSALVYEAPLWQQRGRDEIGGLDGVAAAQLTRVARRFAGPLVVVVGRLAPDAAQLALDVYRIERTPGDQVVVRRAPFTPWHGNRWAAARKYLTPAEAAADPARAGRNPFGKFAGAADDPLFGHIDAAGAAVALGHAMVHYRAQYGVLAVVKLHVAVTQTHTGGWLRRTYTTTEHVLAQTSWRIATPRAAQPWAAPAAYCVVDPTCVDAACSRRACPDPALVAAADVALDDWTGPALPLGDEEIATVTSSSSGWTVLGLGAISDLLAPGLGPAEIGATVGGGATPLQIQHGIFGTADDGVGRAALAGGGALERAAGAALRNDVFGADVQRLAGLRAGMASVVPDATAFDPDAAGARRLDAVRQYQRCRARGLSGAGLQRCAAATLSDAVGPAPP
jgi:hypothetical protein